MRPCKQTYYHDAGLRLKLTASMCAFGVILDTTWATKDTVLQFEVATRDDR